MGGKILFVIQSGVENSFNVRWGLTMALNTYKHPYGEKILDDVKVLLFGMGVSIVNPNMPFYEEFRERLLSLNEVGVEVASCVSICKPLGLVEESEKLGIKMVHASVYVAERVSEGYTVMNF